MLLLREGFIGKLKLKNRVVMAPMNVGGLNNSDGCLSDRALDYFALRAKGGCGMIVTGSVRVTREYERSKDTIPLWMAFADHKIHTKWISDLSERLHDYDCKLAVQLTLGGGRQAGAFAQKNGLAVGPSEIQCHYPPHKLTRELTSKDIVNLIDSVRSAASIVRNGGGDAIQLHGHEGYLIDQFTCSLWNKRKDEFGGDIEGRLRIIRQMVEAIKSENGCDFPVIYRYGISHFIPGGRSIDEGLSMAELLQQMGVDAIDLDAGCYESWYYPHPPSTMPAGFMREYTALVKKRVSIPVIISGKVNYPDIAESILDSEDADFISLGRPLIADPNWVKKIANGTPERIRPCIGCHEGCMKRIIDFKSISCAVNPAAGNEAYLKIRKSCSIMKILVIGGGVAGMNAAIAAKTAGHDVILIEKTNSLGGNFRLENIPSFKYDYKVYIRYLAQELQKLNIDILLETDYSSSVLDNFKPDFAVVAIGARAAVIDIPGRENIDSLDINDCFNDIDFHDKKIVIVGAGLIGTEAALSLDQHGAAVVLVEKGEAIANDAFKANRDHLLYMLSCSHIEVRLSSTISEIFPNRSVSVDSYGKKSQIDNCSYIVIATGLYPNKLDNTLLEERNIPSVLIGDCLKPGKVIDAVWDAVRKVRVLTED